MLPSQVPVRENARATDFLIRAAVDLRNTTMRSTRTEGILWYSLVLNAQRYLEWGSGGTTVVASWLARERPKADLPKLEVLSVDSSAEWMQQLRKANPLVAQAEAAGQLTMIAGNVPDTGLWGIPRNWALRSHENRSMQARGFVEAVPAARCCFDVILVDGRFREACALHALRLSHQHTVVLVHDYPKNKNRRYSQSIEQYYHPEQHDHFGMLRAKPGALAAARSGRRPQQQQQTVFDAAYERLLLQWE